MSRILVCPASAGWSGLERLLEQSAAGDRIELGDGVYEGDTTLHVPSEVCLVGSGKTELIGHGTGPVLQTERTADVEIHALKLRVTVPTSTLIAVRHAARVLIKGCELDGNILADNGILVEYSTDIEIHRNHVQACRLEPDNWGAGIKFESSDGLIDSNHVRDGNIGILARQCHTTKSSTPTVRVNNNECLDTTQSSIAFLASCGAITQNTCQNSKTRSGITIQRDSDYPNYPSEVDVVGNKCHDNEQSGIVFFSSRGRVENNDCWGSRAQSGISIQRDDNSPDCASEVDVIGNRCHKNEKAGIAFLSSRGRVEDNNCWSSRTLSGISIERDQKSPDCASEVDVIGNRCHENEQSGIVFFSSRGRVENNDCWGSRTLSGIIIQRDKKSPEHPSKVDVIGNKSHENKGAGIVFLSSKGLAKNNTCRENQTLSGINIERDNCSPEEPSEVQVIGNRCCNNKDSGIAFFSSQGRVEDNDCGRNKTLSGIIIQRDKKSPEQPSIVEVIGNRCHENTEAGITFLSSEGLAKNNACWENNTTGISIEHDRYSPGYASKVDVIGNTCRKNQEAGISFFSSHGLIEKNECSGSRIFSGIMIQRDKRSPDQPSEVAVTDNICHKNEQSGIAFFSSRGRIENNNCRESRTHSGILIQRDPKSPTHPSEVDVIGNKCHDNKQAGIIFFSSQGRVVKNDCWGNRTLSGISIERDQNLPDCASEVDVIGNRCHHNKQSGIALIANIGHSESNIVWANGATGTPEPIASADTHSPRALRIAHLAATGRPAAVAQTAALADFLLSGGCQGCFDQFWHHKLGSPPQPVLIAQPPASSASKPQTPPRSLRVYQVTRTISSIAIRGIAAQDSNWWRSPRPPAPGLAALTALLPRFGQKLQQARSRKVTKDGGIATAPHWLAGVVSADGPALDHWLEDIAARRDDMASALPAGGSAADVRVRIFDLAGAQEQTSSNAAAIDFIEQHLLADRTRRWQRGAAFLESLLFMPAAYFLAALLVMAMMTLPIVAGLVYLIDPALVSAPDLSCVHLRQLGQKILTNLQDTAWLKAHRATLVLGITAYLLVFLLLLIRTLPASLRIGLLPLLTWLGKIPSKKVPRLEKILASAIEPSSRWHRLVHSERCRRHWLRRQIYAPRLFESLRKRSAPAMIIVLRHVDIPSPALQQQMRLLFELCPPHQALLLVTQVPGLSMLASGYLDVWFGPAAPKADAALVIHDVDSAQIPPATDSPADWADRQKAAPARLAALLGWPAAADAEQYANALIHGTFDVKQWLPALIIGSTPQMHMLTRRDNAEHSQYSQALNKALEPFFQILGGTQTTLSGPDVEAMDRMAHEGRALLAVALKPRHGQPGQRQWIGRGGYRVELARLLRDWCGDTGPEAPSGADILLAASQTCGELYHVRAMQHLLTLATKTTPLTEADLQRLQRLPLHMEAALFLLDERQRLMQALQQRWPTMAEATAPAWHRLQQAHTHLQSAWRELTASVHTTAAPSLSASQNTRLCLLLLRIQAIQRNHGSDLITDDGPEEKQLCALLDDPLKPPSGTAGPTGTKPALWPRFLHDLQTELVTIARQEPTTARRLLRAKLAQDWCGLSPTGRTAIEQLGTRFTHLWLQQMTRCTSAQQLFDLVRSLRRQPALVIAGLGLLVSDHFRQTGHDSMADARWARLTAALLDLRWACASTVEPFLIPNMSIPLDCPASEAATALLLHSDMHQSLTKVLAQAQATPAIDTSSLDCEIEGLALGDHGKLKTAINAASTMDERVLLSA